LASFRRWFLAEFVGQIDGRPPIPWPEHGVDDEDVPGPAPAPSRPVDIDLAAELPERWGFRREGGGTVVTVADDLDLESAAPLRDVLALAHRAGGDVLVDARSVTFLDSLAMSVLVTARNRVVDSGDRFRLEAPPAVVRTLELAGLVDLLGVEPPGGGR
jgi:anti-anti-sigma factor